MKSFMTVPYSILKPTTDITIEDLEQRGFRVA